MEQVTYQAGPVSAKEHDKVRALFANAPHYPTLMLQGIVKDLAGFQGWIHGAFAKGDLHAVACVESNNAHIWGNSDGAVRTLGESMARSSAGRPSTGGTHQLIGEERVIDYFWDRFQRVNRTLVSDRRRSLGSTRVAPECKDAYSADVPTTAELPLVAEMLGEQALEHWGVDPRRANKAGHEAYCKDAVQQGRVLVGRQRGKPVFVCEHQQLGQGLVLIDRAFVPRPLRRPRVIAGVLAHAIARFLQGNQEVLMFVDRDREEWVEATEEVGLVTACTYRFMALR